MSPLEFDPPLSEQDITANIALVGPPKTGKTAGAASAPGPVLYANADLPARMRFARRKFGDKIKPVTVKGLGTLHDIVRAAYSGEFATVVTDPVGDVYRILVEERFDGKVPETLSKPALNQFRVVQDELRRYCQKLCEAPINSVFVFHELSVQGENDQEVERTADAGPSKPKLAKTILGMVDVIGYTFATQREDGVHYVAQLAPINGRNGGDGFNCLLEEGKLARELDLSEWLEVIRASEQA